MGVRNSGLDGIWHSGVNVTLILVIMPTGAQEVGGDMHRQLYIKVVSANRNQSPEPTIVPHHTDYSIL